MKRFRKDLYVFNPQTLKYEKKKTSVFSSVVRGALVIALLIGGSFVMNPVLTAIFPSIQYQSLKVELNEMRTKYDQLNEHLDVMSAVLDNIQDRDANVHRMVFGLETMDSDIWQGGIGGHKPYEVYDNFQNKDKLTTTLDKVDQLSRKLALQSKSLDEIERLASDKEKYLNSIPSIKPVSSKDFKKELLYLSGFGIRMHPVYKIPKMHDGLDFTAAIGTPVQCTGDGIVSKVEKRSNGYGLNILVDHGYGYKTRYAHLSSTEVKNGQRVSKGQKIGEVGNTGTSTAPHLHYEVLFNGHPVDPIDYVMDGLSPEEYAKLVKLAQEANKSLD